MAKVSLDPLETWMEQPSHVFVVLKTLALNIRAPGITVNDQVFNSVGLFDSLLVLNKLCKMLLGARLNTCPSLSSRQQGTCHINYLTVVDISFIKKPTRIQELVFEWLTMSSEGRCCLSTFPFVMPQIAFLFCKL